MIEAVYAKLGELTEALSRCGWTTAECEDFSARTLCEMLRLDKRAKQRMAQVEAARLLPRGANVVAEIQGCHRVTAYRRAKVGAKIVAD